MILEVVDIRIDENKQADFDEAIVRGYALLLLQPRGFVALKSITVLNRQIVIF